MVCRTREPRLSGDDVDWSAEPITKYYIATRVASLNYCLYYTDLKPLRIYLLLFVLSFVQLSVAQVNPASLSNLRTKHIGVTGTILQIDSLSLVPGTFSILNVLPSQYKLDEVNATLRWISKPPL